MDLKEYFLLAAKFRLCNKIQYKVFLFLNHVKKFSSREIMVSCFRCLIFFKDHAFILEISVTTELNEKMFRFFIHKDK